MSKEILKTLSLTFLLLTFYACNKAEVGKFDLVENQVTSDDPNNGDLGGDKIKPGDIFPVDENQNEEDKAKDKEIADDSDGSDDSKDGQDGIKPVANKCRIIRVRDMHTYGLLFVDEMAREKIEFLAYEEPLKPLKKAQKLSKKRQINFTRAKAVKHVAKGIKSLRLSKKMVRVAKRCPAFKEKFCRDTRKRLVGVNMREFARLREAKSLSKVRPYSSKKIKPLKRLYKRICKQAKPLERAVAHSFQ